MWHMCNIRIGCAVNDSRFACYKKFFVYRSDWGQEDRIWPLSGATDTVLGNEVDHSAKSVVKQHARCDKSPKRLDGEREREFAETRGKKNSEEIDCLLSQLHVLANERASM